MNDDKRKKMHDSIDSQIEQLKEDLKNPSLYQTNRDRPSVVKRQEGGEDL